MDCRLVGAKPLYKPYAGILLVGRLETNLNDILIDIYTFLF